MNVLSRNFVCKSLHQNPWLTINMKIFFKVAASEKNWTMRSNFVEFNNYNGHFNSGDNNFNEMNFKLFVCCLIASSLTMLLIQITFNSMKFNFSKRLFTITIHGQKNLIPQNKFLFLPQAPTQIWIDKAFHIDCISCPFYNIALQVAFQSNTHWVLL